MTHSNNYAPDPLANIVSSYYSQIEKIKDAIPPDELRVTLKGMWESYILYRPDGLESDHKSAYSCWVILDEFLSEI